MAIQYISHLATNLSMCVLLLSCAALAILLLSAAGFVFPFLVFYAKESMIQKADKPPVAGTVFHMLLHFDTLFDFLTDIARRNQTFRFIKPFRSEIFTTNPANVEHTLKNNFSKYIKGQSNCDVLRDLLGQGIFAVDGDKWRHQRKLASYEFSTKVLRDFSSSVFRTNGAKLAKMISTSALSSSVFDIQKLLMKSTLDSIFKVGFGVDLNTLSDDPDELGSRFSTAFDDSNRIVFWRFFDVFWNLKRHFNIGQEAQLKRNIRVIDDFVFQLIRQKRVLMEGVKKQENGKEDILSRFILASEKDPEAMTDQYLRDIILNFIIAGKDTSANTLSWFFYMMCRHPLVQEKVVEEIRSSAAASTAARDGWGIDDFALNLTEEVLERMQYLHAALTETLRLYPALPVDAKAAEEDDVLPDGFKVAKGDVVNYPAYAMGRMTYLWGEDAEDFRPERWLQNGAFRPESPFKFLAFHAGPRTCLGKEFAYRQMKIFAAILLHFFKFKLKDDAMNITYRTMFTLHVADGLPLVAFHRFH
ncbi:cytochrome P450 704C1-like isoform X1 [Iris pallida]|uniref:noroxomaritidine synthase n=1 Tax=Iris pallida TaxID=29817 RepID=A0AAX6H831_IRIPA|nr:cytochrome P450 704C1-like isoform X1 [Iris pallida]